MKTFKLRLTDIGGTVFAVGDTEQQLVDQYNQTAAGGDVSRLTIDDLTGSGYGMYWRVEWGCWDGQGEEIEQEPGYYIEVVSRASHQPWAGQPVQRLTFDTLSAAADYMNMVFYDPLIRVISEIPKRIGD